MGKTGWTITAVILAVLIVGGVVATVSVSKKKNRTYTLVYEESPL